MSTQISTGPSPAVAVTIYGLYLVGFFVWFTAAIGALMAHYQAGTAPPWLRSHYIFQIRTFWWGLLLLLLGMPLTWILIGYPILAWFIVWVGVRSVKGLLAALDHRPIPNPRSWLFG